MNKVDAASQYFNENCRLPAGMVRDLFDEIERLQARVDALMLEYCPEEMSKEQLETWSSHQMIVKVDNYCGREHPCHDGSCPCFPNG